MLSYDPNGLFFFGGTMGGLIGQVAAMIKEKLRLLQKAAEEAGLMATGRYALFEFGTLRVFHNDHWYDY